MDLGVTITVNITGEFNRLHIEADVQPGHVSVERFRVEEVGCCDPVDRRNDLAAIKEAADKIFSDFAADHGLRFCPWVAAAVR